MLADGSIPKVEMTGVVEYFENFPVYLSVNKENGRQVIVAFNEGGYNAVHLDLLDVVQWLKSQSGAEVVGLQLPIREYLEEFSVELSQERDGLGYVIQARNEGGQNAVQVDIELLHHWLLSNRAELFA